MAQLLVVFDFDKTLASTEVGMITLNDALNRAFGGAARVKMLRDLLTDLVDNGVALAILSFNSKDVLLRALAARGVELLDVFRASTRGRGGGVTDATPFVLGNEVWDGPGLLSYGGGGGRWLKSAVIRDRFMPALGIYSAANVLFADDDASNVRDVRENLPGSEAVWVKKQLGRLSAGSRDSYGMTAAHCAHICKWVEQRKQPTGGGGGGGGGGHGAAVEAAAAAAAAALGGPQPAAAAPPQSPEVAQRKQGGGDGGCAGLHKDNH